MIPVNAAHLHLMLNHFPLVGFVFSFLILALGLFWNQERFIQAGLLIIVVAGILAAPAYLTGESAEKVIEKLPGFSEKLVENHEEAAELAIWFVGITTLFAAAGLYLSVKKKERVKLLAKATVVLNLISLILMARTSNLGGKIAHPEIRAHLARVLHFS